MGCRLKHWWQCCCCCQLVNGWLVQLEVQYQKQRLQIAGTQQRISAAPLHSAFLQCSACYVCLWGSPSHIPVVHVLCCRQASRLPSGKAAKALEKSLDDIIFAYSYPRLDVEVTKKMNHLLKVRRGLLLSGLPSCSYCMCC